MQIGLIDVAIRWEGSHWVAFNIGHPPPSAAPNWSSPLGLIELDEIFDMFRNSNIVILPAKAPREESGPENNGNHV